MRHGWTRFLPNTVFAQQARWMDTVMPRDPLDMPFGPRLDNLGFVRPYERAGWTTASDPACALDGHSFRWTRLLPSKRDYESDYESDYECDYESDYESDYVSDT